MTPSPGCDAAPPIDPFVAQLFGLALSLLMISKPEWRSAAAPWALFNDSMLL